MRPRASLIRLNVVSILLYTLVVVSLIVATDSGTILAIPIISLFPGYCALAVLFPGREQLDFLQRVVGSIALTIAIIALEGLALSLSPLGVTTRSLGIVAALTTFLTGISAILLRRKERHPDSPRPSPGSAESTTEAVHGLATRLPSMVLASGLVSATILSAYLVTSLGPHERFTELYVVGPSGATENYPYVLNKSRRAEFGVAVVNHEGDKVDYTLRLDLIGLDLLYNSSKGTNQTVETNRTNISWDNFTLDDNKNWSQDTVVVIPSFGFWKLGIILYIHGDLANVYRLVVLYVKTS